MTAPKPWIVVPRPRPDAALRLVCFAYAGGGASAFRTWPDALPDNVELWAVELPGRETRVRDPLQHRATPLIAALADALVPALHGPFAIYGHSLGAILGFRLARELRRRGARAPEGLLVSGRRAPQLPEPAPMAGLSDAVFLDRLARLGGISDAVLREAELMAYYLPILRADIALLETEPYVEEAPLAVPIAAFGGLADEKARGTEIDAWGAQTSAAFEREMFPGGHFFIQTGRAGFLGSLSRHLQRAIAAL